MLVLLCTDIDLYCLTIYCMNVLMHAQFVFPVVCVSMVIVVSWLLLLELLAQSVACLNR